MHFRNIGVNAATAAANERATAETQSRSTTDADDNFVRFDRDSGDTLPDVINGVEEVSA